MHLNVKSVKFWLNTSLSNRLAKCLDFVTTGLKNLIALYKQKRKVKFQFWWTVCFRYIYYHLFYLLTAPQFPANLVTVTKEVFNGFFFFCIAICFNPFQANILLLTFLGDIGV